jgi:hypothetical protein
MKMSCALCPEQEAYNEIEIKDEQKTLFFCNGCYEKAKKLLFEVGFETTN